MQRSTIASGGRGQVFGVSIREMLHDLISMQKAIRDSTITICVTKGAIGSDIGGSLRMPGMFCGVVAFKPTSTRCQPEGDRNAIRYRSFTHAALIPAGFVSVLLSDALPTSYVCCILTED